jgi:hypothetical protein
VIIENTSVSDNVVISSGTQQNLAYFVSRVFDKFNSTKSTCFIVISEAFLDNAKV